MAPVKKQPSTYSKIKESQGITFSFLFDSSNGLKLLPNIHTCSSMSLVRRMRNLGTSGFGINANTMQDGGLKKKKRRKVSNMVASGECVWCKTRKTGLDF